ncbi:hypothetical protein U0070_011968, partial [Myodes glareolus]
MKRNTTPDQIEKLRKTYETPTKFYYFLTEAWKTQMQLQYQNLPFPVLGRQLDDCDHDVAVRAHCEKERAENHHGAAVYQISRKDKFPKKMYMGVCSVESIRIRKIMRVFPIRDSKYTVRNITNNASCSAEEPGNPRKMNSATAVLLVPSIVHHRSGRDHQLSGGGRRKNLYFEIMTNSTLVTEFLLEVFAETWELRLLLSVLFLLVYLGSLLGNLIIIIVTTVDQALNTPMYYFLRNLSILDMCYVSVTVPNACVNSLTGHRNISVFGCATQVFLVFFCACVEILFLTVMAQDRYVAICKPLLYPVIMNHQFCVQMTLATLFSCLVIASIHTIETFQLSFCHSNVVSQIFCDIPPLLKLSCSNTFNNKLLILLTAIGLSGIMESARMATVVTFMADGITIFIENAAPSTADPLSLLTRRDRSSKGIHGPVDGSAAKSRREGRLQPLTLMQGQTTLDHPQQSAYLEDLLTLPLCMWLQIDKASSNNENSENSEVGDACGKCFGLTLSGRNHDHSGEYVKIDNASSSNEKSENSDVGDACGKCFGLPFSGWNLQYSGEDVE